MRVGDQKRREIVVRALGEFLDPSAAEQAISLYDVEFADQAALSVTNLVARLDETLQLGSERKKLYLHLSKATRDATSSSSSAPAASAASEANMSPAGTVFAFLVRELVSRWKGKDASSLQGLSKHVSDNMAQLGLSPGAENETRSWASAPESRSIGGAGTDDEMRRLLQSLYVWSCEWFGPVDTDKLVADAVRSAERIPAASQFSPRKFL